MASDEKLDIKHEKEFYEILKFRNWELENDKIESLENYKDVLERRFLNFRDEVTVNLLNQRSDTGQLEYCSRVHKELMKFKIAKRISYTGELSTIFKDKTDIAEIETLYEGLTYGYFSIIETTTSKYDIEFLCIPEEDNDQDKSQFHAPSFNDYSKNFQKKVSEKRIRELIGLICSYNFIFENEKTYTVFKNKKQSIYRIFDLSTVNAKIYNFLYFLFDHYQFNIYKRAIHFIEATKARFSKTLTKNYKARSEIINNPSDLKLSFECKEEFRLKLKEILIALDNELDSIVNEVSCKVEDLYNIFTSADLKAAHKKIYLNCSTVEFAHLISAIKPYIGPHPFSIIEKSKLFYSKYGTLLSSSNLSVAKSKSKKSARRKEIIDMVLSKIINKAKNTKN